MSMKRFKIAGHSMMPALQPGEEVVATDTLAPVPGDIVVFEHPQREGFWLIKRLVSDDGYVLSDNPDHGTDDSRSLGPIPIGSMQVVVRTLDEQTFAEAAALLTAEDSRLAEAIERHGMPAFWSRRPGLESLVLLILEQQVSLESGAAMYRRLARATGGVDAKSIAGLGVEGMRSIGVTRQKAGYLFELAQLSLSDGLDVDSLAALPWQETRGRLVSIKGIGPWTAEAYLLSSLRVPDMWPVGDRALMVGTAEVLGLTDVPNEAELEILGEPWRPVRAVAARIIWHAYLTARGRVEPPDPTAPDPTTPGSA